MRAPAPFIVVEGLDGTGKSTLVTRLAAHLGATVLSTPPRSLAQVRPVVDAVLGTSPRAAQLFYAGTVAWASDEATRLVHDGTPVVCDRYLASTLAYDLLRPGALELAALERVVRPADVTLHLRCDERVRRARIDARGATAADEAALAVGRFIDDALARALSRPFAGRAVPLDTTHLDPDAVLARAIDAVEGAPR